MNRPIGSIACWNVALLALVASFASFASFAALALVSVGCVSRNTISDPDAPSRKFSGTSYYQAGTELFMGVDVRAARVGGPQSMLPVYLVLVKTGRDDRIYLGRESFILELPDGSTRPLASYQEWKEGYGRSRPDSRLAGDFVETIAGRYPEPPFSWLPLEFFPPKGSSVFSRQDIDLRGNQVIHGYLYFPLPQDPPLTGRYKLLMSPQESETTYVVDFPPFKDDGLSK